MKFRKKILFLHFTNQQPRLKMKLSVGIVTYNEENNLPRTLNAIKDIADEIIIVDSGSTDSTPEIASRFGAKFHVEKWKGIGHQKNSVIDKCHGEWILLIDADEEISTPLKEEIKKIVAMDTTPYNVYQLRFQTICFGRHIRHGGWSGFYRYRFFRKNSGRCNENQVHEKFVTSEKMGFINKDIYHYTYKDLASYIRKFNEYTSESAEMYLKRGKKKSAPMILLSAMYYFVKSYIFQLGILDGYYGYLLSKFGAMTILVKYAKLQELQKGRINSH